MNPPSIPDRPDVPAWPPRPDVSSRVRRSRGVVPTVVAACLVVALVSGVLAIRSGRDTAAPAPTPSSGPGASPSSGARPSPSATPTPGAADPATYRFINLAYGTRPVRWDACEITYRLFVSEAPDGYAADVEEAFRRLESATGFHFVAAGVTGEEPGPAILRVYRSARSEGADIDVLWQDHGGFEDSMEALDVKGNAIAWATPFPRNAGFFTSYGGAIVVLDADAAGPRGFDGPWFHGVVLMHELGHAMGLGHVGDPHQIMYSGRHPDLRVDDWGSGDLEGLRLVGAPDTCAA